MSKTKETGVDFVQRVTSEIRALQEDISNILCTIGTLQTDLKAEQQARAKETTALHDRISQERAAETLMRNNLEAKHNEFESNAKAWVGTLGREIQSVKELVPALEAAVAARAAQQQAASDLRFAALEKALPTKADGQATAEALQKLEAELSLLTTEVERDRHTAAAAVRTAAAAAAQDFRVAEDRCERLEQQTEANKRALLAQVGSVSARLDAVDAFAQTRAKATDVAALEPRVYESERGIERLGYDLKTKASSNAVSAVSDRLASLAMEVQASAVHIQALEPRVEKAERGLAEASEALKAKGSAATLSAVADRLHTVALDVQANLHRSQADKDAMQVQISLLEKAHAKVERQLDSDRDRTSQCVVALEKEINTKAAKADVDLVGPHTLTLATQRLESRAMDLEEKLHIHRQEAAPLWLRLEALEAAFPTRADAADIPRLSLAIADVSAKHDALHSRTLDHGARLERTDGSLQGHLAKIESVESRAVQLERKLAAKAEATEHYTKENTTDLLRDFYRREEIDAMLSRVWWRVGDMTKGRLTTGPGTLSARAS